MKKLSDTTHKVTDEQATIFVNEVRYWVDKFGLKNWQLAVLTHTLDGNQAECRFDVTARKATIILNESWETYIPVEDWMFARVAFHEVCELLLCPVSIFAGINATNDRKDDAEQQTHCIIRILESVLWKPDWDARNCMDITH